MTRQDLILILFASWAVVDYDNNLIWRFNACDSLFEHKKWTGDEPSPSDWVVDDVNGMFENSRVATATEVINYRVQR